MHNPQPNTRYQDKRGQFVTVKYCHLGKVVFVRDGYTDECTSSINKFTREFTLVAGAQVLNTYRITGYGVNPRGLTVGFSFDIEASDSTEAMKGAIRHTAEMKLTHTRIRVLLEVRHG